MFNKNASIEFEGWTISNYLGAGASARIYKVEKNGQTAALKVFDPGIFSGDIEAEERLKRQKSLIGINIDSLAQIFSVGEALIDGNLAPALLMELCPGNSLEKPEIQAMIDEKSARSIISATARAAKHLMDIGIAHRDIKPANIVFDSSQNKTFLLDTGVIQLIENHVDVSGYEFVGSKRYSPPEFIFRMEEKSTLGWTAVTFYQLGATLYELVFKRRPYANFMVHAQLTNAIGTTHPNFDGIENLSPDIQRLFFLCFKRDWKVRLGALSWETFTDLEKIPNDPYIINQQQAAALIVNSTSLPVAARDTLINKIKTIADECRERALSKGYLTKLNFFGLSATLFVGKSSKKFNPALTLSLDPTEDNAVVLTLTRLLADSRITSLRLIAQSEIHKISAMAISELETVL